MTKVTIIDVDLGENVEDIIDADVKKLTEKNQKDIDEAIAEKKQTQQAKEQKANAGKIQTRKFEIALASVYDTMIDNHKRNLTTPIDIMLKAAEPTITSSTSLIMRLKGYIKEYHGNEYVIKKCRRKGKTHYQLIEYNAD
jgi:hypothetical protein